MSDKYKIPVLNIHQPPWGILFTGKRGIKRLVNKAKFFGATSITVHLATARRQFNSSFFDWIKELEKESGISAAFENGNSYLESWPSYAINPEELDKFVSERKVAVTLDVPKASIAGADPYQFFKNHCSEIKVIHAHGFKGNGYHLSFRAGDFDWFGFMSFIKKFNYGGLVTLEVFPMAQYFYFGLPSKEKLESAKKIVKESFEVLKRSN